MRADLMLCRAAAALAGWEQRSAATDDDLRRVAPFVLGHRRRRLPFDQPGISQPELDQAFEEAQSRAEEGPSDGSGGSPREEVIAPDAAGAASLRLTAPRATPASSAGNRSLASMPRGRFVRDRDFEDGMTVAAILRGILRPASISCTPPYA